MKHVVLALEDFCQVQRGDIAFHVIQPFRQQVPDVIQLPGRSIVDHRDLVIAGQALGQMRADEPAASGDDHISMFHADQTSDDDDTLLSKN